MYDILVAGELNPDLILSGDVVPRFHQAEQRVDSALLALGSSSAIFACGAVRLGLKTALIGICGDDVFGRFMMEELEKRGVDTGNVLVNPRQPTGLSVILNTGNDRAILTLPGLISALRASDITDELLRQARHLHVASYFLQTQLQPDIVSLFTRARRLGLTVSLDTNYDPSEKWMGVDRLFPLVNVLLPNEREAMALSGTSHVEEAAHKLSTEVETLAIKLGPDGALGMRGGVRVKVPSIPVTVVDAVGAGDSFDAGFLYGYLNRWDLERSLYLACVCGALSARKAGGTDGQPKLEEAMQHVPG